MRKDIVGVVCVVQCELGGCGRCERGAVIRVEGGTRGDEDRYKTRVAGAAAGR